jgi:hypothetical protein
LNFAKQPIGCYVWFDILVLVARVSEVLMGKILGCLGSNRVGVGEEFLISSSVCLSSTRNRTKLSKTPIKRTKTDPKAKRRIFSQQNPSIPS